MDDAQAALAPRLNSPSPGFNRELLGDFQSDLDNFHDLAGLCTGPDLLVYTPRELLQWAYLVDSNTVGVDGVLNLLRNYI